MPTQNQFSRGGAKPRMISGSQDVLITVGAARKSGIYEFHEGTQTLARRVELPGWLSDQVFAIPPSQELLPFFVGRRWRQTSGRIAESKGHIFLDPPAGNNFGCPLVGIDVEICDQFQSSRCANRIVFVVYGTDYVEVERWVVSWPVFLESAELVETQPNFMPQWMLPLDKLCRHRI